MTTVPIRSVPVTPTEPAIARGSLADAVAATVVAKTSETEPDVEPFPTRVPVNSVDVVGVAGVTGSSSTVDDPPHPTTVSRNATGSATRIVRFMDFPPARDDRDDARPGVLDLA